jgi:hypothetical protein
VVALLEWWSELTGQGREIQPAELCADCLDLLPDVERAIHFLRGLNDLVVPEIDSTAPTIPQGLATLWREAQARDHCRESIPVIPNHDILGLLGSGGMGVVYRARDRRLGRIVALKVIRQGLADSAHLARFQTEAEAVARLNHPHVVQVYEVGCWQPAEGGELPYLTMEHVKGHNLEKRLGHCKVTPVEAVRLMRLLLRAVRAAHSAGVVHRDLKPGNVLLAPPADEPALNCAWGSPKLTDFGLARCMDSGGAMRYREAVLGTPGYMAPEQADGQGAEVGPAADVYSLGAILYWLLTGQPPFQGSHAVQTLHRVLTEAPVPPRQLRPGVPEALQTLCLRCLEKDPARRPNLESMIAELERFESSASCVTAPGPATVIAARRDRMRPLLAAGLAAVLLGGLACALALSGEKPLQVRALRVMHHARMPDGKGSQFQGELGETSFKTRYNDAVTIDVELSRPAHFYLLAFNADGKEQLLWPADGLNRALPGLAPEKLTRLHFPQKGRRFTLNDEPRGGLQVFAVLASRQSLPAYAEWKQQRGRLGWVRQKPGKGVWQADHQAVWTMAPGLPRGTIEPPPGAPPLEGLCQGLRSAGVEVVEAIAFAVLAKEEQ